MVHRPSRSNACGNHNGSLACCTHVRTTSDAVEVFQTAAEPNASRITSQCNQLLSPRHCRDGGTANNLHLSRVTSAPLRLSTDGLELIQGLQPVKVFRCFFTEGEIGGTSRMRSHISVHRATTKYFSNSFIFKNKIEKEGLPRDSTPDLGAGGPRFKSGRPDQNISRIFFSLSKALFTQNVTVEFS